MAYIRVDTAVRPQFGICSQSDIRTVARVWFEHDVHDSIAEFVSQYPLKYVDFGPHDEYSGSTRYQMPQLVRLFLLKEITVGTTKRHS